MTTTLPPTGDEIDVLRTRIDALDEGIIRLIRERRALSAQVQTQRLATGGVRLALSRERQIIETYCRQMGNERGGPLADAVLRACRGPL